MPQCRSTIETLIRTGLSQHIAPDTRIFLPAVHANRGTFTCPVYVEDATDPIAIFRLEAGRALVGHEAHTLIWIKTHCNKTFAKSIPQIIWHGTLGSRQATLQTYINGHSPTPARRNRTFVHQLNRVSDWLIELYSIPLSPTDFKHRTRPKTFDCYLNDSEATIPTTFQNDVARALAQLQHNNIHPVLCHADLHVGNMLISKNGLCVLDWEYADMGWPVFDWFYFLCTTLFEHGHQRPETPEAWQQAVESIFFSQHKKIAQLARRATETFFAHLNIVGTTLEAAYFLGIFDFFRRRLSQTHLEALKSVLTRLHTP